ARRRAVRRHRNGCGGRRLDADAGGHPDRAVFRCGVRVALLRPPQAQEADRLGPRPGQSLGMSSPAERYAAAQASAQHPRTRDFAALQRFDLDPFQVAACHSLEGGRSVLVAAPTGAGKTIVGEFAIHLAMQTPGTKAFYTTPMKALSN